MPAERYRLVTRSDSYGLVCAVLLSYGGGHANAGTCQVGHDDADRIVEEIVGHLDATSRTTVSAMAGRTG